MSLYLGIDSGTQSTKAIVLDLTTGRILGTGRAPHQLVTGLPAGHMEQHPQEWVTAMEQAIEEALQGIDRSAVRGIGVSGQQHGFVPLDAEGKVIRPAKLWCDTSTADECMRLTKKLGGAKAVIRQLGVAFLPGYTAPKILWLKRHEPANYRRLRHVLLPHDYLNYHLTGNYFMEQGDASGTALMDVRRRKWSTAAINAIGPELAGYLPKISSSSEPVGLLRSEVANKLGLSHDVLVSAGGGDNMMGAIGTGNVRPGVVTASFGTSGTIYAHAKKPVVDPTGEIAAFCDSTGSWLPLLCTMNVTTVTEQVRTMFGWDHAAMDRAVASAPAGAGGLFLLPYLEGERTPSLPDGSGVLFGLNSTTLNPGYMARAAMEGVTLGMNYGLMRLKKLGVSPSEIRLTGGGAKSPVWRQIMADIFGVPVVGIAADEGAALGAALQAAWTWQNENGARTTLATLCARAVSLDESTRCKPDRKAHARYVALQHLHDATALSLGENFISHRQLLRTLAK
jgi:D-xylulose kinase